MRYKPGHKEEARRKLVAAAGRGFRKNGYGGIGVDGLAHEASVTSGAFYGHFKSKEAAFDAVVALGMDELAEGIRTFRDTQGEKWLTAFVDFYLGYKRECDLGDACALQALSAEVGRSEEGVKATYAGKLSDVIKAAADGLEGSSPKERADRAIALLSLLSGGVTLARAVDTPEQSKALAASVRRTILSICRARALG